MRDSDAIDTESLCIIAGEKVWCITCDIRVLNYSGNLTDACNIAAVGTNFMSNTFILQLQSYLNLLFL